MLKLNLIYKILFVIFLCISSFVFADDSVFIEEMTSQEVTEAINNGKKVVIIFSGSTEQNGSQIVLGKHNYMAHYFANAIARELGNALVYPIFPFAPTGDPVSRSGHMAYIGSISLRDETYKSVIQDLVVSAISSGFKKFLVSISIFVSFAIFLLRLLPCKFDSISNIFVSSILTKKLMTTCNLVSPNQNVYAYACMLCLKIG